VVRKQRLVGGAPAARQQAGHMTRQTGRMLGQRACAGRTAGGPAGGLSAASRTCSRRRWAKRARGGQGPPGALPWRC
jgi:hypothetical protein